MVCRVYLGRAFRGVVPALILIGCVPAVASHALENDLNVVGDSKIAASVVTEIAQEYRRVNGVDEKVIAVGVNPIAGYAMEAGGRVPWHIGIVAACGEGPERKGAVLLGE